MSTSFICFQNKVKPIHASLFFNFLFYSRHLSGCSAMPHPLPPDPSTRHFHSLVIVLCRQLDPEVDNPPGVLLAVPPTPPTIPSEPLYLENGKALRLYPRPRDSHKTILSLLLRPFSCTPWVVSFTVLSSLRFLPCLLSYILGSCFPFLSHMFAFVYYYGSLMLVLLFSLTQAWLIAPRAECSLSCLLYFFILIAGCEVATSCHIL